MELCKHDICGSGGEQHSGNLKLVITRSGILDVFLKFSLLHCFVRKII